MLEALALGFVALVGLAIVSALFGLAALVFWVVLLPFRLLGFAFRALGALLLLPVVLVAGIVIAAVVGIPLLLVALVPVLPIVLLIVAIAWLAKRGVSSASPVR